MKNSKFCKNCKQRVNPKADLTGKQFVIMLLLFGCMVVPGIIYIIYAMTSKKFKKCPICTDDNFDTSDPE